VSIQSLDISNFRNIKSAKINCSPDFNLFCGENAAGKTNLLDAIYYLSNGKSSQTTLNEAIIHENENQLTLIARILKNNSILGVQRFQTGSKIIRIDANTTTQSELSLKLPVLFISANSHYILTDGPRIRRQFLDWGLFHTNKMFYSEWKKYQKLISHRNAALKSRVSKNELSIWNIALAESGESLHAMRKQYCFDFLHYFNIVLNYFKLTFVDIYYDQGWDSNASLISCLENNYFRELHSAHTLSGPHRADLKLSIKNFPAEHKLSQGQQKLVSYALRFAQGLHFHSLTNQSPIYLIDDLPSELDTKNRDIAMRFLINLNAQVFLTAINTVSFNNLLKTDSVVNMFHVKHGEILQSDTLVENNCFT